MATQSSSEPTDELTAEPRVEPARDEPARDEIVPVADPARDEIVPVDDPDTADLGTVETVSAESAPVTTTDASAAAQPTVVFVQTPQPPRARGARGVGALAALLGTGLFAAAYAALVFLLAVIAPPFGGAGAVRFLGSVTFWVPVTVFFLSYLLLVIVVNRAGWWAHVLGGFVVAVLVWVGFVGAAIIAAGVFGGTASAVGTVVLQQLTNPLGFAAAIAAREVPIWVGGLVSKRGRTARARNAAARTTYNQELAEHRATIGATTAV